MRRVCGVAAVAWVPQGHGRADSSGRLHRCQAAEEHEEGPEAPLLGRDLPRQGCLLFFTLLCLKGRVGSLTSAGPAVVDIMVIQTRCLCLCKSLACSRSATQRFLHLQLSIIRCKTCCNAGSSCMNIGLNLFQEEAGSLQIVWLGRKGHHRHTSDKHLLHGRLVLGMVVDREMSIKKKYTPLCMHGRVSSLCTELCHHRWSVCWHELS